MVLCLLALAWLILGTSFALAQGSTAITPTTGIGSLGTTVTTHGHTIQITGGARPDNGTNVFHSFEQFSVGRGDSAQFLNTTPSLRTDNILSRVTGGAPSVIFGSIDTMSYPGANLFLMNPAGIVFGPNAMLNVGGSVAFTTADYLRLADDTGSHAGIFHSNTTATSLLTSAPVTAFGFIGTNPSAISVHGTEQSALRVQPNQSITLIGGDRGFTYSVSDTGASDVLDGVTIVGGRLHAPGGHINVASVGSPGEIRLGTLDQAPNINGQTPGALGAVQISQQAGLDTKGEGNGRIIIRAGHLVLEDSTISGSTGDVTLNASSIQMMTTQVTTETATITDAGNIALQTSGGIVLKSAIIASGSEASSGNAGDVLLSSSQGDVNVADSYIISFTDPDSSGDAGFIKIDALNGNVLLANSSIFNQTSGTGPLRGIQITANDLLLDGSAIQGDNLTKQVAGDISLMLQGQLNLSGSSTIKTQAFGQANAAHLRITARDITVSEESSLVTSTISSGNAGQLHISADTLLIRDGGKLSSESRSVRGEKVPSGHSGTISIEGYRNPGASMMIDGPGSGIFSNTEGTGVAGDISVKASSVTLQKSGTISAGTIGTSHTATGGSIIINATDQVTLTNGASITASSVIDPQNPANTGNANAGNISINAGQQLEVREGSSITTQAAKASGGNIDIRATDRIRFVNSTVSTSVLSEDGKGGNIFIDPNVVILEGSQVTAKAVGGAGGNITVVTPLFLKDSISSITAKSESGLNGTVLIQSPTSNLSGTVGQLVSKISPPQVLLQNRCVALASGGQSTFLLAGRDTLPTEPDGWLNSPVSMEHMTGEATEQASSLTVQSKSLNRLSAMTEKKDNTNILSLRQLTPPGFLVRTFATGSTGCPS